MAAKVFKLFLQPKTQKELNKTVANLETHRDSMAGLNTEQQKYILAMAIAGYADWWHKHENVASTPEANTPDPDGFGEFDFTGHQ